MEATHMKNAKTKKEKFIQGCISVFKKWSAFRIAIDDNPKILTYYNEDETVLEINEMLETLYDELFSICDCGKFVGKECEMELADCLNGFIEDYFNISLEDESDIDIARILMMLYEDLQKGSDNYLTFLKNNETKGLGKFSIEFPILGNQKIIFEKDADDEDDEEEDEDEDEEMQNEDNNNKTTGGTGNSNNDSNKMEDGPDEEGFVVVKKKKGHRGI